MSTATTEPRLVRRNYGRGHGYRLDGEKVPGVTTVLNALAKPALVDWAARTVAERAIDEWDELGQLPPSQRLERLRWGARETVQAAALRGNEIHALGERLANGEEVVVPAEHVGPVEAYARWLDKWQITTWGAETPVASIQHKYAGTGDLWGFVGKLDNAFCLLDVKTGKGVYNETAYQLAAYRYADVIQHDGLEEPVPEVDAVYVAHVLPDDVRMVPVEAGPQTFRTFLYILAVYRGVEAAKDWPLIGEAIQP